MASVICFVFFDCYAYNKIAHCKMKVELRKDEKSP